MFTDLQVFILLSFIVAICVVIVLICATKQRKKDFVYCVTYKYKDQSMKHIEYSGNELQKLTNSLNDKNILWTDIKYKKIVLP